MYREAFKQYLMASNVEGSGKASSYVRGLDLLGQMIAQVPAGFDDCRDVWAVDSVERLEELYACANAQAIQQREILVHEMYYHEATAIADRIRGACTNAPGMRAFMEQGGRLASRSGGIAYGRLESDNFRTNERRHIFLTRFRHSF